MTDPIVDFLQETPFFAELSEEDLQSLCEMVETVKLSPGEQLFAEGERGDRAYIIRSGELEIVKVSGGREVLLAVRQTGEMIGEMSLLEDAPRMASVRARSATELLSIRQEQFDRLLRTSPSASMAMLHTVIARWRATEAMLNQSEKMAQLGTMTAGIAHELNNPSAAVQRGAQQLRDVVQALQTAYFDLQALDLTTEQRSHLKEMEGAIRQRAGEPVGLDALTRSDREESLAGWLKKREIARPWEHAPTLVDVGYSQEDLAGLEDSFSADRLAGVLAWLSASFRLYSLLEEIYQGAARISEIIKALKSYVYLDQAPVQAVDVHKGLDDTLVLLRNKLKGGVTVHREYADVLPRIEAYGSELNQVWTNLIDNAVDAMDGQGEITLRTRWEGEWVVVEVEDNGPGIPEEILPKIFDPFFTTKPPGKGTGLGLDISYNIVVFKHKGDIDVSSRPGETRFTVRLPVSLSEKGGGAAPNEGIDRHDDDTLHRILQSVKTVAVVGLSTREDRPSHEVSAYLQSQGYRIIPVNPNYEEVLGEESYPDLPSVPESVDVVLIFRQRDAVPGIVEQAIEIGAPVVWMQEGIVHEDAAETARAAGIKVVMDTCMRATHKRLIA